MTAGLILAAGAGTRFGEQPKQLAPLGGRPLLRWAVDAQCAVGALHRVVVVLGARAGEIRGAIDLGRAEAVDCPEWATGQSASLRCGLRALSGFEKVVVTLGDAPFVTAAVIERFATRAPGTRALYDGRPGHPVVLGPAQIAALLEPGGGRGDRGARELLRGASTIEVGHLCSGADVDTPEDLEEMRRYEARAVI